MLDSGLQMVGKLGRPALPGERYACGKRRPTEYRSDVQIRRMMDSGLAQSLDPILGTYAGILCKQGHLTARQLSTVDYVARVYGRFEFYQAPGRRRAKSPAYEAGLSRSAESGEKNELAARAAKEEFDQLQAILATFAKEHRDALESLCVDNLHIPMNNWGRPGVPDVIVMLEVIDQEVRGAPAPEESERKRPKLDERVVTDQFAWHGDGGKPRDAKRSEATIHSIMDRLEKRGVLA